MSTQIALYRMIAKQYCSSGKVTMLSHFSNHLSRSIRKPSSFVLALCAFSYMQAQTPTAPTAAEDPETIDQIWQKASSKYDSQRAALLKDVDAMDHRGPFRPDWESLQKYEAPEWYRDAKFGSFIHWGTYSVQAVSNEWYPRLMYIDG